MNYGGCEVKSNISRKYCWSRRKALWSVNMSFYCNCTLFPSLLVLPLHHNARKAPTVSHLHEQLSTHISICLPHQLSYCLIVLASNNIPPLQHYHIACTYTYCCFIVHPCINYVHIQLLHVTQFICTLASTFLDNYLIACTC